MRHYNNAHGFCVVVCAFSTLLMLPSCRGPHKAGAKDHEANTQVDDIAITSDACLALLEENKTEQTVGLVGKWNGIDSGDPGSSLWVHVMDWGQDEVFAAMARRYAHLHSGGRPSDAALSEAVFEYALGMKDNHSIRLLAKFAPVAVRSRLLKDSILRGDQDGVNILMEWEVDFNLLIRGETLLHAAIEMDDEQLVSKMLDRGADPCACDWLGINSFDWAVVNDSRKSAEVLKSRRCANK